MSPTHTQGQYSQRALLPVLRTLIDAAMAPNSTAHRDQARAELRHLLETENWRTKFMMNNLSSRRMRYVASLGPQFWVPSKWTLTDWKLRPGEDKPEAEE